MAFQMKWCRHCLLLLAALTVAGIIYLGYFCSGRNCPLTGSSQVVFKSNYDAYFAGRYLQSAFGESELRQQHSLDIDAEDVLVFLHIQKTGGTTFGKHLVNDLALDVPCDCYKNPQTNRRKCDCLTRGRQIWLFSRHSTGWACGLHADWTELNNCVDDWFQRKHGRKKRRYYYVTMLRDPVARFVSEWLHVRRGATWKTAKLQCNGREATLQEVPFCYSTPDWTGVSLEEFMSCPHNLAINRQTRMLANLTVVNCYNATGLSPAARGRLMLQSAKDNLVRLSFFGLSEFQRSSQFLFEHMLGIQFLQDFDQRNDTKRNRQNLTSETHAAIVALNHLDVELYQFAKDLFLQRATHAYAAQGKALPPMLQLEAAKTAVKDAAAVGDYGMELTAVPAAQVKVKAGEEEQRVSRLAQDIFNVRKRRHRHRTSEIANDLEISDSVRNKR